MRGGRFHSAICRAFLTSSKGTEIATLAGQKSDTQLQGVMFSHDGSRIATVSVDGSARLWDGISGRLLDVLGQESAGLKLADIAADERDREINSVFSHDDRYLATTSLDGVIRIWDVDRGSLLTIIRGHTGLVEHVEYSPVDNKVLLTASHDGTARLWDIDGRPGDRVAPRQSTKLRDLQPGQCASSDRRRRRGSAPVGYREPVARWPGSTRTRPSIAPRSVRMDSRVATASSLATFLFGTSPADARSRTSSPASGCVKFGSAPRATC